MPEFIGGNPAIVRILFEGCLTNPDISIVETHSGNKKNYRPAGANTENTGNVYTKQFRIYNQGKATTIKFKIVYNKRDNWADIRISWFNLMELKLLLKQTS